MYVKLSKTLFFYNNEKGFYFFIGGRTGDDVLTKYLDTIVEFDIETETWSEVGKMKVARGGPGVSVVTLADVLESATDCVKVDAKV